MATSNLKSEFAERISWPLWLWLLALMILGSIYITFWAPFGTLSAIVVSLFFAIALVYSWQKSHLEIVVINSWLYVGSAKIESKFIKKVTVLKKDEFLKIRGPKADPACFNATRFWVTTGVKVEINDKKDPTPYWLISSRKAKALAKSLS